MTPTWATNRRQVIAHLVEGHNPVGTDLSDLHRDHSVIEGTRLQLSPEFAQKASTSVNPLVGWNPWCPAFKITVLQAKSV